MDARLGFKGRTKTFIHPFAGIGVPKRASDSLVCYAGMVGAIVKNVVTGLEEIVLADGNPSNSKPAYGLIGETRTTTPMFKVSCKESATFDGVSNDVTLKHPNIVASTILVTTVLGVPIASAGNWTINTTNGILTRNGSGTIGATDTVIVTYQYVDVYASSYGHGINEIGAANRVTMWINRGEIQTLIYDIPANLQLNDEVCAGTSGTLGVLTKRTGGLASAVLVGTVSKVPTTENPFLGIKLAL